MLNKNYSHIEDLLMIAQAWRITDMKELENMIETFTEIIQTVLFWSHIIRTRDKIY